MYGRDQKENQMEISKIKLMRGEKSKEEEMEISKIYWIAFAGFQEL